jgi:hypothetical protein
VGSIGNQKYPDRAADEAAAVADVLVRTFDGDPPDRDAFAREVGHRSADSGAFKMKLADARRYGLLPGRGVEPTDLARDHATAADDEARRAALFRMYRTVPLLDRLYDRLDGQPPADDLGTALADVTGVDPATAEAVVPEVGALYARMREHAPAAADEAGESGIVVRIGDDRLVLGEVTEANLEVARLFVESRSRGDGG